MSSDSTELTFVRCPSCRSLVPAVSTRCRMCGSKLDTPAAAEPGAKDRAARRVRQRTVSETEEVASTVEQIRSEMEEETSFDEEMEEESSAELDEVAEAASPEPSTEKAVAMLGAGVDDDSEENLEDPLSDYLEDIDDEGEFDELEELSADETEDDVEEYDDEDLDEMDEDFLSEFEDLGDEDQLDELSDDVDEDIEDTGELMNAAPAKEEAMSEPAPPWAAAARNDSSMQVAEEAPAPEEAASGGFEEGPAAQEDAAEANRKDSPKKVIIETGGPRVRGGLSFGKKREDAESSKAPAVEQKMDAPLGQEDLKRGEERDARPAAAPVNTGFEKKEKEERKGGQEMGSEGFASGTRLQKSDVVQKEGARKGKLFGWLVSFNDAEGSSVELREGRFFASRNSLKASDLIIDDPSIATPHALLVVGSGGMKIQDLMSERGVFYRPKGADSYRRELDSFKVEHGDWIRFGDVEFLVSLIAHVGMK